METCKQALTSCGQVAALHDDSTLRARVKNDDETGLRAPGSRYLVTVTQSAVVSTRFSSCISRADSFQRFTALSTTGDNSDSQLSHQGDHSASDRPMNRSRINIQWNVAAVKSSWRTYKSCTRTRTVVYLCALTEPVAYLSCTRTVRAFTRIQLGLNSSPCTEESRYMCNVNIPGHTQLNTRQIKCCHSIIDSYV